MAQRGEPGQPPPAAGHQSRRWRERADALGEYSRQRAEEYRRRAEGARRRWPAVARAFDVVEHDRARLGGLLAGALTFRLFLWLLPFSLLLMGTLGGLAVVDADGVEGAFGELGIRGVLAEVLGDGARQRGWWLAALVGVVGTLYAGIGVARVLRLSHAAAWGMAPVRLGNPLVVSSAVAGVAALAILTGAIAGWVREWDALPGLGVTFAVSAVAFVVWVHISSVLPHPGVPLRALVPGAVLIAVGLQGLHLFAAYVLVHQAERVASVYGTIGTALTLLLWLFVIARLMVWSAVLNAELWRTSAHNPDRVGDADAPDRPPADRRRDGEGSGAN